MINKTTISGILLLLLIVLMNVQAQEGLADWLYDQAAEAYDSRDCILASGYVSRAVDRYTAEGNAEGISKCNELMPKINDCLGDSYYEKALTYLELGKYGAAMEYAKKAQDIYRKINDTEGVAKTEQIYVKIWEEVPPDGPRTTLEYMVYILFRLMPFILAMLIVDLVLSLVISIRKKLNFISVFIKVLILSPIAFIIGYILECILCVMLESLGVHYTVHSRAPMLTTLVFAILLLLSAVLYIYRKQEK
jgi:tetratricopeptide (TPR) repeat protein